MWNGLFFQRSTLKELGLRVQLGHSPGQFCPTREPACKDFVVIHTNGIHLVNVDYCRCNSLPHRTQLLRTAWWPATPIEPKTCATMEVLRHFQHLNLQGKLTGYSFYRSLEYETDNTGLEKPPVRCFIINLCPLTYLYRWNSGSPSIVYAYGSSISTHQDVKARRESI